MAAVQFNLLPDVKLKYVKAQHTKRLLISVSTIVSIAALFILLLSFVSVDVVQKKSLRDLDSDTTKYSGQLQSVPNLNQILTVQNQLSTLTSLHDQKPVTSRLFGYISELTPAQASLDNLTLDLKAGTLTLGGRAPSLDVVSAYTDTLKAASYKVDGSTTASKKAFSQVVLASFGRDDKGASFSITATFDPAIFQSNNTVTLSVPSGVSADQSSIFGDGN